jgi:hypothetical protein
MNSLSIDDTATAAPLIARPEHCRTVRLVRRAA